MIRQEAQETKPAPETQAPKDGQPERRIDSPVAEQSVPPRRRKRLAILVIARLAALGFVAWRVFCSRIDPQATFTPENIYFQDERVKQVAGRIGGDIEEAGAVLAQRQAELEDLRGQVQADVRKAYLDVEAARSQVEVARLNIHVSEENLKLTRQRFDAGVADNLTVVQSQESVAGAELDYINSVFAQNVAKLRLARAAEDLPRFLEVKQK